MRFEPHLDTDFLFCSNGDSVCTWMTSSFFKAPFRFVLNVYLKETDFCCLKTAFTRWKWAHTHKSAKILPFPCTNKYHQEWKSKGEKYFWSNWNCQPPQQINTIEVPWCQIVLSPSTINTKKKRRYAKCFCYKNVLVTQFVKIANNNNDNIAVITGICVVGGSLCTNCAHKNCIDKMLKQAKAILWRTKCISI